MKTVKEWHDVLDNTPGRERDWLIRAIQEDAFKAGAEAQNELWEARAEEWIVAASGSRHGLIDPEGPGIAKFPEELSRRAKDKPNE